MEDDIEQISVRPSQIERETSEIYHICFLLRQKLVADVVPLIIHHAGLFKRFTCSTGLVRRPLVVDEDIAPRTCFITPSIRSSAKTQQPVKKIAFLIQSCDQGAIDHPFDGGCSWTWFTAGLLASPGGDDPSEGRLSKDGADEFLVQERQIFRNERASAAFKTHVVQWTVDSLEPVERDWVSSLQRGDRIAVRAWAQYPGWQNHLRSVSVAIYTATIVR